MVKIMKKPAVLLLCLALGAACLTGCTHSDKGLERKSYSSQEEITGVSVDARDREIEVTLSIDDKIHIDYFESDKEYYDISVSQEGVLTMTSTSNKAWTDYIGAKAGAESRKISLQLPDKLLTALTLSTTNEDISLPAMTINGDLSLSSQGGNIAFDRLKVKNTISLKGKNGDISGQIAGSYDDYAISCDIKKGESNLPLNKENGAKSLTASNNNGNIDIEFISE